MNEIWKDIPIAKNYEASNLGNIRNKKTKHIIKQMINSKGYSQVSLYLKKKKTIRVHRLVASAFLENKNNYGDINHIDGNKLNNNVDNLEWCTRKENIIHSWKKGLSKPHNTRING